MDLSKILTIAGKSGLFKVISQTSNGVIVESLTDGKKMPVFASHRSSSLEDISLFTLTEDKPLKEVLWEIYKKEDGKPAIDPKSDPAKLKSYFEEVVPDYDKDRVYTSHMKKVLTWYHILLENDLITEPETKEQEESKEKKEEEPQEREATSKPKEKTKPEEKKGKTQSGTSDKKTKKE